MKTTLVDKSWLPEQDRNALDACLRPSEIREPTPSEMLALRQTPDMPRGRRRVEQIRRRLPSHVRDRFVFRENVGHGFDARFCGLDAPVLLLGTFNDERYFKSVAASVRAAFRPSSPEVAEWSQRCGELADGRPIAAVGFRHDVDYATLGWTLPDSYYRDASATLSSETMFVVFGDHKRRNLEVAERVFGRTRIVASAHHLSAVDQMNAMSAFDTLIIPNSTFSWWSAWLADSDRGDNATVIAPDPWVYFDNELVPDRWTKLAREGGLQRPPPRPYGRSG